ncbi:MAG TPA: BON domain-containing protein, partial [Pyrinomonadaceae bacterium]
MRSKTILTVLGGAALCLAAAGCGSDANTNVNVNVNANRAANANANATPAATATPVANANSRNYNMTREDYNKNANGYIADAKNAGDSIGSNIEDGWIHLKVRGALAAVDDLRDSTINVDVDNNVVTLRGSVASAAHKSAAEKAAKVEGVKSVSNKLEVKADGS